MKKKAYRLPILSFMITPIDSQFDTATLQRFLSSTTKTTHSYFRGAYSELKVVKNTHRILNQERIPTFLSRHPCSTQVHNKTN